MNLKRIIIAGEGGQGIQALAHIMVSAAFDDNKKVSFLPNFGIEQRGGVSLAYIQISDDEISFPKFQKADVVVLLAERAVKRIETYLKKETILIFDNSLIDPKAVAHLRVVKIAVPASYMAKQKMIPRVFNIIMLGALTAEIESLNRKKVENEIVKYFSDKISKEPQLKHFNLLAYRRGYEQVASLKKEGRWREKILKK